MHKNIQSFVVDTKKKENFPSKPFLRFFPPKNHLDILTKYHSELSKSHSENIMESIVVWPTINVYVMMKYCKVENNEAIALLNKGKKKKFSFLSSVVKQKLCLFESIHLRLVCTTV